MSPEFDLAVIGGGPAGAAAAWGAARRGLRVALLERGGFPRDRVCGEFVSAEAMPLLEAMAPELLRDAPAIAHAELIPARGGRAVIALAQAGRGIPRSQLDVALWQAAGRAGAHLLPRSTVVAAGKQGSGWALRLAGGGDMHAPALIVAAGRWWHIEGLNAVRATHSPWVGIKARFRGSAAAVEMYAFRGGYCGIAPVGVGEINVCALVHRRLLRSHGTVRTLGPWLSGQSGHPGLARRLQTLPQISATLTTAPAPLGRRRGRHDGTLLAGDAFGFLDPFTGAGLARAMLGGWAAAAAVADGVPARYAAEAARAGRVPFALGAALRPLLAAPAAAQQAALWLMARPALGGRAFQATRCSLDFRP